MNDFNRFKRRKDSSAAEKLLQGNIFYFFLVGGLVVLMAVTLTAFRSSSIEKAPDEGVRETENPYNDTENIPVTDPTPDDNGGALPVAGETEQEKEPPSDEPVDDVLVPVEYTLPVDGVVLKGYSEDMLVYSETLKDWRVHLAYDIATEEEEPVLAAADGTVTAVYDDPMYGTTVCITHSDGVTTVYSSLGKELNVGVNSIVTKGQMIGKTGNTAPSELFEGYHLHFAVEDDGKTRDPKNYVTGLSELLPAAEE